MLSLVNWVDVAAIAFVVLVVIAIMLYFVLKKVKGQKVTDCDCASKGKEMRAYYNAQKKKDEKKKNKAKSESSCCCNDSNHSCCD